MNSRPAHSYRHRVRCEQGAIKKMMNAGVLEERNLQHILELWLRSPQNHQVVVKAPAFDEASSCHSSPGGEELSETSLNSRILIMEFISRVLLVFVLFSYTSLPGFRFIRLVASFPFFRRCP